MLATTDGVILELNRFPNKPWFLRVCSTRLLKTPWENEKLLVFNLFGELPAIFIKLGIVVCKLFHFGIVENLSFGKGLKDCQKLKQSAYMKIKRNPLGKKNVIACQRIFSEWQPSPIAQSVALRTSEQEVAGSISGLVNIFPRIDDSHC